MTDSMRMVPTSAGAHLHTPTAMRPPAVHGRMVDPRTGLQEPLAAPPPPTFIDRHFGTAATSGTMLAIAAALAGGWLLVDILHVASVPADLSNLFGNIYFRYLIGIGLVIPGLLAALPFVDRPKKGD